MIQMYEDCFARVEFRCGVLKDTLCKNGSCPFYKSKQKNDEDKKEYPHRDCIGRKKKEGSSDDR